MVCLDYVETIRIFPTREYSENLGTYLGSSRKTITIPVSEISEVISKITGVKKKQSVTMKKFQLLSLSLSLVNM